MNKNKFLLFINLFIFAVFISILMIIGLILGYTYKPIVDPVISVKNKLVHDIPLIIILLITTFPYKFLKRKVTIMFIKYMYIFNVIILVIMIINKLLNSFDNFRNNELAYIVLLIVYFSFITILMFNIFTYNKITKYEK